MTVANAAAVFASRLKVSQTDSQNAVLALSEQDYSLQRSKDILMTLVEKYNEAVSCFEKAAAKVDNMFAANYLLKAGVVYEEMGNTAKALEAYKKIREQYPQSLEGYDIDKYISRVETKEAE